MRVTHNKLWKLLSDRNMIKRKGNVDAFIMLSRKVWGMVQVIAAN